MANYLAQFCTIKNSCDHLVIAVEDVSDLWPAVKEGFEERLPFAKACLNNKTRNQVVVEKLPAEFILTTDSRLRSRFPQEQSLFWFREPYATVILVTCEDLDEFKTILKPRLKLIVQNDEREWFIVFVSKVLPSNDQATKLAKRVFARLEVDFNSKRRERCCKLDLHGIEPNFWEDFDAKIVECIRNTLDKRVQFYEEEVRKLSEQRFMPIWNFCNFFILKESLAFMFDMAHLHEDALREYDELELCYLETGNCPAAKQREFGGLEQGDDQAMLLQPDYKPLNQIIQDDSFREFEFRQYLFACQSKVFKPRPLVDISAAISSALLMNELQWIGLIIKPINYSLRGSILQIDTGPELVIEGSNMIEIESFKAAMPGSSLFQHSDRRVKGLSSRSREEYGQLHLINGTVELPDWASDISTIVWLPVRAVDKKLSRGTSTAHPQKQSVVDGMRTVALTLEFGTSRNQKFERTIAVHFTDPFHVSTRLADKGKDGTLVLQVILHSQVKASLKINDAWLDLQDGFMHVANGHGRPSSCIFPFVVSPSSRAGMIFCLHLKAMPSGGETNVSKVDSILNIKYEISGSRIIGAHTPASVASDGNKPELFFKSAICLQRPVLDPSLAVGFLPFSSDCLRVGQLFNMEWRVERLKQEIASSSILGFASSKTKEFKLPEIANLVSLIQNTIQLIASAKLKIFKEDGVSLDDVFHHSRSV